MNWDWINNNWPDIGQKFLAHLWLAAVPTIAGLLIAVPLGVLAQRRPWLRGLIVTGSGLLYTVPSLALFVLLPSIIGTKVLDPLNIVLALTVYSVALLVRTVADGLHSVAPAVLQAATAMGYRPVRRLLTVELPLAIPVIGAGLRVASVSNVAIVSVAALIGIPQLGTLFTQGLQEDFSTPIVVGIVGCVLLAVLFDLLILLTIRRAAPWQRAVR